MLATVRALAGIINEQHLSELSVETASLNVKLVRVGAVVHASAPVHVSAPAIAHHHVPGPAAAAPTAPAAAPVDDKAHTVTSPFVGTFYRKPNPDAAAYVSLNGKVEKGQVLCIVEAMKLMNEIEADVGGVIVGILVEDGAPVEYGQALFKIRT